MFSPAKSPRTALSLFLCISLFVCSTSRGEDSSRKQIIGELQSRGVIPVDEGSPSFPYPRTAKNRW
jgi:hypothetical protein